MKRVIKLTESDLKRIVKRTIKEYGSPYDDHDREEMFREPQIKPMDVSSDSDYYKSRKREVSIPGDELGVLLQFAKKFCESKGVRMGDSLSSIERDGFSDCHLVAKLNRQYPYL